VGHAAYKSEQPHADTYHFAPGVKVYSTAEGGVKVVVPKKPSK
jgi:hypothetical protein